MRKGFTIMELLITIAILGVLAGATVLIINPTELVKRGRDATRLSDVSILNSSLAMAEVDTTTASFGSPNTIYVSLPDTDPGCANLDLPALPEDWAYACVSQENTRKIDGTGWVPVNFSALSIGTPLAVLPVDPINNLATDEYYTYTPGGSWVITNTFESQKYIPKLADDKGLNNYRHEIGSDLVLLRSTPFGENVTARRFTSVIPVEVGSSFSLNLLKYFSGQVGAKALTLNAQFNGGELPEWITLSPDNILSGTPDNNAVGSYTVTVSAYDAKIDKTGLQSFELVVSEVASPVLSIPDQRFPSDTKSGVQLSDYLNGQIPGSVTFVTEEPLPKWLNYSIDGILSGTPTQNEIGTYSLIALLNEEKIPFSLEVYQLSLIPDQSFQSGLDFRIPVGDYIGEIPSSVTMGDDKPLLSWMTYTSGEDPATSVITGKGKVGIYSIKVLTKSGSQLFNLEIRSGGITPL